MIWGKDLLIYLPILDTSISVAFIVAQKQVFYQRLRWKIMLYSDKNIHSIQLQRLSGTNPWQSDKGKHAVFSWEALNLFSSAHLVISFIVSCRCSQLSFYIRLPADMALAQIFRKCSIMRTIVYVSHDKKLGHRNGPVTKLLHPFTIFALRMFDMY